MLDDAMALPGSPREPRLASFYPMTLARRSTLYLYGLGSLSPAIKGNLLGAPIFYYYNNVLGLDAWLVSLALAIALVFDAVSDPLVGYLSDHTHSRLGRRHPYIYASIVPGALFYLLLLTLDVSREQSVLFVQLLLLMTALRLAWTLYQVPREALGAELSKDYVQRTELHGLSAFFGWIGGAGIAYATSAYFLGDSYDNLNGYRELAVWGGGAVLISGTAFCVGIHREIPNLEPPRGERPGTWREVLAEILDTLNHRSWLMLFLAGVVYSVYVGITTGLAFYFNSFFWDWKPSDVAVFALLDLVAALAISYFAGPLTRNWDKKRLAVALFSASIVIGPLLALLRLSDLWYGTSLLPDNGPKYGPLWWIMLFHQLVMASLGVLAWVLVGSMTADVIEDSQKKTGKRSEGLFFAGPQLIQKSVSGAGLMIKGVILSAVGFAADGTHAQKVAAVVNLAAVTTVLGIVMPSLALWIFSRYEITRSVHDENLGTLGYTES
jgi:GPH family glycoside/pentoside/hexuronide:cation symporter